MADEILHLIIGRLDDLGGRLADLGGRLDDLRAVVDDVRTEQREFRQEIRALHERFDALERRMEALERRMDGTERRLDVIEREQTRLRVDLMAQMERMLDEISTLRTDLNVAVAFAARADAATETGAVVSRALQRQMTQLRARMDRLDPPPQPAH